VREKPEENQIKGVQECFYVLNFSVVSSSIMNVKQGRVLQMAKAINWPLQFREEVIAEGTESEYIALRLGQLYYENRYWVPDEVVDIRVNHKKIRKGIVIGDLRQCAIQDLTDEDLRRQKRSLQDREAIIQFLSTNYDQPVDQNTLVTIITYKNYLIVPEEMEIQDDPHM
jgi:hypothetical protein